MANDTVLITGASGMIGFRTLVFILEAGYNVRAAVRNQASFDKISSLPSVQKHASQLSSFVVPDITIPGAYDEAVKGVKYIIHVASPLAGNVKEADYEDTIIRPAIQGTVGILESSMKAAEVKRVVITASVASIASGPRPATSDVIDENIPSAVPHGPFKTQMAAYSASKALAYQASKEFIVTNKPAFDVIRILPVFVLGRDETVTEANSISKGTNGLLMGPLLGHVNEFPQNNTTVHVDDVARMHMLALDPKIAGDQDFLAAGPDYGIINWIDAYELVRKRYSKQYEEKLFTFNAIAKPPASLTRVDNGKARSKLGVEFKTGEEQVCSVIDHYLELLGRD